jgi:GWxTD domain-containing protein
VNILESLVATPFAVALGWAVLHSVWQCAAVAAALALVLWVLRAPQARYVAGCAALAATAGAFAVTLVAEIPAVATGIRTVPPIAPRLDAVAGAGMGSPARDLAAAVPWLAPFWFAGVWLFYLRHAAGWFAARRLRRRGVCAPPIAWTEALERLRRRLQVSRPVMLLESCLVEVPVVLGHLRPAILMPAGVPPQHLDAILAHELAHIRRCDYLVNLVQRLVEGLLFYHPAVWWVSHAIRMEREICCDDAAVTATGDARQYAHALAALEHNRWPVPQPAVAASGGNLVKRVRRLLDPAQPGGSWSPLYAAVALILTGSIALSAWQAEPKTPEGPYGAWLTQDVAYIIQDQERAAFLKLTTDDERGKFVEQFWERRNPIPGVPENKFKEEHYRRIAYANSRYATRSQAGWRTDRGRIYILYGPPDEVEAHPGAARPSERWLYRHRDGIGDDVMVIFVDLARTGDYRMTPAPGK